MAFFEDDPKSGAPDGDDPIASLFQGNRAMPAPKIAEAPSEAEITRWHTAARSSLFEESVPDPSPPPPASSAKAGYAPPPAPDAARRAPAVAAPPPPPPPPPARPPAVTAEALLAPALPPTPVEVSASEEQAAPRKRRVATGPKKSVLIATGIAAALSLGTAAAVLNLIPNPFGRLSDPAASASGSIARLEPAAKSVAVAPKPVAAMLAKSPPPAPVVASRPVVIPMPEPVAAAPAPAPAPAAVVAAVPVAPKPAPAPVLAAPAAPAAAAPQVSAPAVPVAAAVPAAAAAPAPAPLARTAPPIAKAEPEALSAAAGDNARLIAAANKSLAEDDPKAAEALMRQALAADPDDHHAMEVLVHSLIDQDRGADAVPFARKMVKRRAKRVPYRLLLGDALLMTGDEAGARREWKAALDVEPQNREVRMRLGL
jgi:hypothetical protein